jgi:pSer/pThr/pTyr-binding forkhead associated (FHA) protein
LSSIQDKHANDIWGEKGEVRMQAKLKVIGGKNDGREIKLSIPEFIIGRGEDAHLKPSSDLISRRHCAIRLLNNTVEIEDLQSRNGTFINGEQIQGKYTAAPGDLLRVGQLQFEIVIDHAEPSAKRPKVEGVAAAAERTATSKHHDVSVEDSISDWLSNDETPSRSLRETTMLSLEDTKSILAEAERKAKEKLQTKDSDSNVFEAPSKEKKEPGKLPPKPKFSHDSSKVAADDVLRKFFNRR